MEKKVKRVDDSSSVAVKEEVKNTVVKSVSEASSLSDIIWNDIKDRDIEMFALPGQKVFQYCKPIKLEPSKLYVEISASAVLPALETAVGSKYSVNYFDKTIVSVSKK